MKSLHQLVKNCKKNKKGASEELYRALCPKLMGISLRMSPDKETARDLIQESFIKIFTNINKIKGTHDGQIYNWCKLTTTNTIIDYLRREHIMLNPVEIDDDDYGVKEITDVEIDTTYLNLKNIEPSAIMDAINTLTPSYKAVFSLVIDGYKHEEVSNMLGISVGTSKSNYAKARYNIIKVLEKEGQEEVERVKNYEMI